MAERELSRKTAAGIFFGTIFVLAAIFALGVYMEDQKNFQMTSYVVTQEELAKIKSEYNLVGTTAVVNAPNYEDVAVSVFKRDGKYEIAVVKYGDKHWVPDIKYKLNMVTTDGTVFTMDRSFARSIFMSRDGKKDILPVKNMERWKIEFT